jgi:hypothetical protein
MFEVYYRQPRDHDREARLTELVAAIGGRLDYSEEIVIQGVANTICLTYEFEYREPAERAAELLRDQGEHVEGPVPYGP